MQPFYFPCGEGSGPSAQSLDTLTRHVEVPDLPARKASLTRPRKARNTVATGFFQ